MEDTVMVKRTFYVPGYDPFVLLDRVLTWDSQVVHDNCVLDEALGTIYQTLTDAPEFDQWVRTVKVLHELA